jgi:hypothetical protein
MITREFLNKNYSELVSAILLEGAIAECERIRQIDSVTLPGHEELAHSFIKDGKSTAFDVALAIVNTLRKIPDAMAVDMTNPTLN